MKQLIKKLANLPAKKTDRKLIVLLSDDWGSVRIKSVEDQKQLIKKGYSINNRFDQFDTLESNADMEGLFEVLLKYNDHKGNHPVITAVANVGNPDFDRIRGSNFQNFYFETVEQTYQRYPDSDKVLELVRQGIKQNIFVPQSHGREHVQANWWLQELQNEESFARKVFDNEFFFLGPQFLTNPKRGRGIGASFDVWDQKDVDLTTEIAQSSLSIFNDLYGYHSKVFTPPAMFYNTDLEITLVEEGIEWLDVCRFFKVPLVGGGERHQFNYLGRKKKSGLKILVRNCVFESNMSENDNGVAKCMHDIAQAFEAKQPALISNHRASFVGGIDSGNRERGLRAIDMLFKDILKKWPDAEFITGNSIKF